jgi:predicted aspartyl protease
MQEEPKQQAKTGLIGLILVFLLSLAIWTISPTSIAQQPLQRSLQSYLTSSPRMKLNQDLCMDLQRNTLVSSSDLSLKEQYMGHFNISFQVDGYPSLHSEINGSTNLATIGLRHPK